MERPIQIGLMGLGTVGSGVFEILVNNGDQIARRAGGPLVIKRILVRDIEKDRGSSVGTDLLTVSSEDILNDPDIDIVVELMGGTDPAFELMSAALQRGKHVVTANKEVVAKFGDALIKTAGQHGSELYYEAAVAAGIPIIKSMKEALVGNRTRKIMGIINGTTNYILTKMTSEGVDLETVLKEAQDKGYAEADPASDVEGYDAAYKIAILASLAFETPIPVEQVYCEGITRITPEDIEHAKTLGYVLKLLAVAKETAAGVEARVHPTMIPSNHPLAAVNDVFNAIFVEGDAVGDLMFYGRGAGKFPTGSAVVADIVDAAQNLRRDVPGRLNGQHEVKTVLPIDKTESRYYILFKVIDKPGVLATIAKAFGDEGVSIESVIQKGEGEDPVNLVFVTHRVQEENVRAALYKITLLPVVRKVANVIRVEGE